MQDSNILSIDLDEEEEEESFVGDLDSYTDTMSDFEDK